MANRICSINECGGTVAVRGWCWKHYQRWRVHGVADLPDGYWKPGCGVPGCDIVNDETCHLPYCAKPHFKRGVCAGHYKHLIAGRPFKPLRPRRPSGEAEMVCEFGSCKRPRHRSGLCASHYGQRMRSKPLTDVRPRMPGGISASAARDEQGRKRCASCDIWMDESSFGPNRGKGDRLNSSCKKCCAIAARERRLKSMGITAESYEALLASQGGGCAICHRPPRGRSLDIDHDHSCCPRGTSCGRCVRGLLCAPCNKGIGLLGDSSDRLSAALKYLATSSQDALPD